MARIRGYPIKEPALDSCHGRQGGLDAIATLWRDAAMASLRHAVLCASLAAVAHAQANAVPGTDVNLYEVDGPTIYGRRGPAYPNGEVGVGISHAFCNAGTVHVPWVTSPTTSGQMTDEHFKIAFLLARESNGRMVQISKRNTYVKHSRVTYNLGSSLCGTCQNGPGSTFRIGCFDAYSTGFNGDRFNLGPSDEIDPWLGTFNPVGSYFDRGDPAVAGAQANDGTQSLTSSQVNAFDPVKNRITVAESDLLQSGQFYAQAQLLCEREPVANRGNNLRSARLGFNWNGNWQVSDLGNQRSGSILNQWSGARVELGGNGNDDGRFAVAARVTGPVGGLYRYEYAVHNIDNHRGAASFRIPLTGAITVQNVGFRDIDDNPLNDWTFSMSSTELAWSAAANNALDWNTIYNFYFESPTAPGAGGALLEQARLGGGALTVAVPTDVPGGVTVATLRTIGSSCGSCKTSFYEHFANPATVDLAGSSLTMTLQNGSYRVGSGTTGFRNPAGTNLNLGDDTQVLVNLPFTLPYPGGLATNNLRICSNGFISPAGDNGTVWIPLPQLLLAQNPRWAVAWHDYAPQLGGSVLFESTPSLVTVTWLNVANSSAVPGTSTFQAQFEPNGNVHFLWQSLSTAGNGYLMGWSPGAMALDPGNTNLSAALPAGFSLCGSVPPRINLSASARPLLGTTIQRTTGSIAAGTPFGVLVTSLSEQTPALDLTQFGMPGCFGYTNGGISELWLPNGAFSVSLPLAIPSGMSFMGLEVVMQSFSYVPVMSPLGLIASNGVGMILGPL